MTQRAAASADTDVMLRATAFLPVPTMIVVELGPCELHVYEGSAVWYLVTGRRLGSARWGRC